MRALIVLTGVALLCTAWAADKKKDGERSKTFTRLIPADVLRGITILVIFI